MFGVVLGLPVVLVCFWVGGVPKRTKVLPVEGIGGTDTARTPHHKDGAACSLSAEDDQETHAAWHRLCRGRTGHPPQCRQRGLSFCGQRMTLSRKYWIVALMPASDSGIVLQSCLSSQIAVSQGSLGCAFPFSLYWDTYPRRSSSSLVGLSATFVDSCSRHGEKRRVVGLVFVVLPSR